MQKFANNSNCRKVSIELLNLAKKKEAKRFLDTVQDYKVFENIQYYTPYCQAMTINSFNMINVKNPNLWDKLSEHFYTKLKDMTVGDILMSLNAFTQKKQENIDWKLIEGIILVKWPEVLEKNQIIFLPYIFSKNLKGSSDLWNLILKDFIPYIKTLKETAMVNNVWSFYSVKLGSKDLWNEFEIHLLKNVDSYQEGNLTKLIFALSNITKSIYDLTRINKKILELLNNSKRKLALDGRDLAYIYFSLVALDIRERPIQDIWKNKLLTNLKHIKLKDLIKLTQSLKILNDFDQDTNKQICARMEHIYHEEFDNLKLEEAEIFQKYFMEEEMISDRLKTYVKRVAIRLATLHGTGSTDDVDQKKFKEKIIIKDDLDF